jgi:hypothetical protein
MQNETADYDKSETNYQDIYIASNSDLSDTVTITCRDFPKWSKVITLEPHQAIPYHLSTDTIFKSGGDANIESDEVIDNRVFRVKATSPITCYGMSNKVFTADAFLALPIQTASTYYMVMSYYNSTQIQGQEQPSEFAVASFDDGNIVTIVPTAQTRTGSAAGAELKFTLDAGQCVQIQAEPTVPLLDLTGSIVSSTKPVVVYGGHARTEAPIGFSYNQNGNFTTSRDHLSEAIPPVSTWGKSFLATNLRRPDGDIVRVLASVDGTTINVNGKVWGKPLKAGEFRDTLIDYDQDVAVNNIIGIESDNPILVGLIAHTAPDEAVGSGDPFLAIVPPLHQTYTNFTYFISTDSIDYNLSTQYVIVATHKFGAGAISIDNVVYPAASYTKAPIPLNGGQDYYLAILHQDPGIHIISSPTSEVNGFTILGYGFGKVISYGYTAGALLKPLKGIISLDPPVPGIAPGIIVPPSITVRNILAERVYFDSAIVSYSQNPDKNTVKLKDDISLVTGTIEMAEEKELPLVTAKPVEHTITGKVTVYYHSRLWMDMWPVEFPFTITPQSQADVKTGQTASVLLENYPNPSLERMTVRFIIPSRAYVTVKIYDALGRVVKIVTQGITAAGDHSIGVNVHGLATGSYTLELLAPELGINEHKQMIIGE